MIEKTVNYRVIYGDTDAMGLVYYANYLRFYEIGRSEYMRSLGFPYMNLSASGIECPAVEVRMKYHSSAHFDDLLTITTSLKEIPKSTMVFVQKVFRENQLLNEAEIQLCFLNMLTHKPVRCPGVLRDYFKNMGY
ncbi:MAG: YbgC/FadM family acyl-CoA thioesterase [Bacteroidales bacterium]|jgi:acyl-CoA thioester hydrolase|nr:YbgC/FadM family acyl-CoA thioesterase [Bacteroidales bacterium]HOY39005.1 YbgC/FadM family acyl-CoA thioesterase [Bacteroidales bacterium]HQP03474.1 YbgC/FadM family acyl-CoA thioesterase [Bacteroidales bacterium]